MLINNTIESSRRPGIPGPHRPDLKWFKDALDGKSDVGHVHKKKDITDFEHTHDGRYYRKDEHELQLLLSGNGTPNFNQGINGDYYVDELNGDLYKKSGDAWNLIIHLEGEQGIPGPQGSPGVPGPQGNPGEEGYTPVRGTDYWTPEDEEIIRQSIVSEVQLGLSGKVDKVAGKGLSTEDFTTLLKQKLEELQNYDDRDIRELLEKALYNVTIDVKTGILTFHTIDESTFTVDLPLELIVSDGYLNKDTNTIVLVLANGNTIDIPVENLIKDFYSKSEVDQKIDDLAEEVAINFEDVDEELAKAQAQIDALKAENEAQQKELDVLYNDLVPGEASGEIAVVANGVTGSKVEIDGDGNTVQEVIEAVEGTTVIDTSMNLTDVDTTFENLLLPMGNISQETREAYQLLSTDEANLTIVQGSDAAHLQYYDDGFINAFNNINDAETELIYIVPTKHITSGKKYTLGIEYKYTNRASIYLRNAANDESVKALNTNSASSIKLTNTANSNYMSVSVILKANASATFRLTLAEGTEQKPWQTYDPDYVIPSLKYPSPVKGVGGQENVNKLPTAPEYTYTANGGEIYSNGKGEYRINGTFTATTYFNFILNEEYKIQKGDYLHCVNDKSNGNVAIALIYNNEQIMFTSLDSKNKIQDLSPYIGRPFNRLRLCTNANNTMDITVTPMITKNSKNSIYTPNNKCRYNTKIENENIYSASIGIESGYLDSTDGTIIKGSGWKVTDYIKIPDNVETVTIIDGWGKGEVHCFYDENKKFVMARGMSGSMINAKIPLTDKCKYARFTVNYTYKETCMIAFGDTDTFVEHAEKNLPIDIPVGQEWYSGKPYKLNGKWYRDVEWEKYTITGKENAYLDTNGGVVGLRSCLNAIGTYCDGYSNIAKVSKFYPTQANTFAIKDEGTSLSIKTNKTTLAEALKEFTDAGAYVVYPLKTPTREEITDETLIEQLEALQNAEFYDGVTNINSYPSSEDVAEMPLEAHYNFITPAPSPDRDSEVEIAEAPNMLQVDETNWELTDKGIKSLGLAGADKGIRLSAVDIKLKANTTYYLNFVLLSRPVKDVSLVSYIDNVESNVNSFVNLNRTNRHTIGKMVTKTYTPTKDEVFKTVMWGNANKEIFEFQYWITTIPSTHYVPYGHIGLLQRGKNFFDLKDEVTDLNYSGIKLTTNKNRIKYNGTNTIGDAINPNGWGYAPLKYNLPAGNYIFSLKKISGSYNKNGVTDAMYLRDEDKKPIKDFSTFAYFIENNHQVKFTNPKAQTVYFQHYCNAGITFDNLEIEIQIEKDNGSATEIEEPKSKVIPIDLQGNTLAKVGDIKDILNISVDGSVKLPKNTKMRVFNGSENWIMYNRLVYIDIDDILSLGSGTNSNFYTNYFKYGGGRVYIGHTTGKRLHIDLDKVGLTDITSVALWKQWLSTHNLEFLYQTNDIKTIPLPSIKPITLFEGTNNFELVTNLPTTLTAYYKVSSKKQLIENNDRITALEATVNTLLGGN